MDQQKLVELLEACQVPDTQKIKAATAELKQNYYPRPEALIGLLHVIVSHTNASVRQLAAVQSLRLVPKHWKSIDAGQKPTIRNELLQAVVRESQATTRHGESRVVAAIASVDFKTKGWEDLLPTVLQLTTSEEVVHREAGSYIVFSLLEADPYAWEGHLPKLFELFAKTIKDPSSRDVRVNTMLSISSALIIINVDEDESMVAMVQDFIPTMVDVLKDTIDSKDEEKIGQVFEVFQTFLGYDSALFSKYFIDLVRFMMELAANPAAESDVRSQALSFLCQCVRARRMKIQGVNELGSQLTKMAMSIAAEVEDDDDDDDETSPARSALSLIDQLSTDLPPRQVVVPVLDEFPKYVASEKSGHRRAAIRCLGHCAEGAPDFVSTQILGLMPAILGLLNDPNQKVRYDSLVSLMRMGEELGETMQKHHGAIMEALVKNLDAASENGQDEQDENNVEIIRSVCGSIETLSDGLGAEIMNQYAPGLISRVGRFLHHPSLKVKATAAGALGSMANTIEDAFKPYLKDTIEALSLYVNLENGEDELALRSAVVDAMGHIAVGVGAEEFQPYAMPLLQSSEKALTLGNARLRETTFILWSQLSRVYKGDLGDSLSGIFQGLFDSLEMPEDDEAILDDSLGLVDGTLAHVNGKIRIAASNGNGINAAAAAAADDDDDDDDEDGMDSDSDEEWGDIMGVSAAAMEKEIAIEVIGDVINNAREKAAGFIQQAIELIAPLSEHLYEGCRKAAISTLWRTYAAVWDMMEEHTGNKWKPGLPVKEEVPANVLQLGDVVVKATLALWGDESDRDVVTEINRNVAAALKACGPSILTQKDMTHQTITALSMLITRCHPAQLDLADEEGADKPADSASGSSEWDWLVVDTALDVMIGLAAALGPQFGEIWKVFEKHVVKLTSSQDAVERSTAVGVVAECAKYMGSAVSPYTKKLLPALLHRLSDSDQETKSNAAYGVGLLVYHTADASTYASEYPRIMRAIEPMLHDSPANKGCRVRDNAAGCISRLVVKHPERVPLEEVVPVLIDVLPLEEDWEENAAVWECVGRLYELQNPTIQQLTPQLMPILEKVLGPPLEQLEPETRAGLQRLVQAIQGSVS